MLFKIPVVLIITLFAANLFGQSESKRVLFIGNSLTEYEKNKMPLILNRFIEEKMAKVIIETHVRHGYRLKSHNRSVEINKKERIRYEQDTIIATTIQRLINENFDFIVLQDPDWFIYEERQANLYPSIQFIDSIVKSKTNSKILFYQTIPAFKEPITFCSGCNIHYSRGFPESGKVKEIKVTYQTIENQMDTIDKVGNYIENYIAPGSKVIPTGEIIVELYKRHPKLKMNIPGNHPSVNVQYALAVAFYSYLTKNDPRELKFEYKLKSELASEIKSIVYDIISQKTSLN